MNIPNLDAHRRSFRATITELASTNRAPILLYGAGDLAAQLEPLTIAPWGTLVGIIDDSTTRRDSSWAGLPLLRRDAVARTGARSVIVTALNKPVQEAMAARAAELGLTVAFCPDLGLPRRGPREAAPPASIKTPTTTPPPISLNLGGGWAWGEPGWLNLDESTRYNFGTLGLTGFPDGCVQRIYSSHAMEHIPLDAARRVLTDCRRALKPGGVLRIIVPDCERFVRAWRDGNEQFLHGNPALAAVFSSLKECTIQMGGNPAGLDRPSQIGHHFFYDRWSLTWLLLLCGFDRVQESSLGQSLDPAMTRPAVTDERGDLTGGFDHPRYQPISVYMEAVA